MQKTAARTRVRARWRKVYLVVVAVRILVAERELSCQAKRIQDEAQERVRNQAAKDQELLIRLDRYEKGERPQQAPQEDLGFFSYLSSSSSSAIPWKRRAEEGAKDDGGVAVKVSTLLIYRVRCAKHIIAFLVTISFMDRKHPPT